MPSTDGEPAVKNVNTTLLQNGWTWNANVCASPGSAPTTRARTARAQTTRPRTASSTHLDGMAGSFPSHADGLGMSRVHVTPPTDRRGDVSRAGSRETPGSAHGPGAPARNTPRGAGGAPPSRGGPLLGLLTRATPVPGRVQAPPDRSAASS